MRKEKAKQKKNELSYIPHTSGQFLESSNKKPTQRFHMMQKEKYIFSDDLMPLHFFHIMQLYHN